MCNGRVPGTNNFTHVSHRGKSVLDYILTAHEQLMFVSELHVKLMSEVADALSMQACHRIPDHSMIHY